MTVIQGVAYGIGLLILAYLAFKNAGGVSQIFNSGAAGISNVAKTLQGR